tara:strand:+ start:1406 stop:1927 length:522 start_codon:yes stop_codon:yes gene_type:complete
MVKHKEDDMDFDSLFYYDNGSLRNKITRNSRALKGGIAGSRHHTGYFQVQVEGTLYMVHRLIWNMFHGAIEDAYEIDHINHIRDDNRIQNLRIVTRQGNRRNQSRSKKNTSGVIGVSRYNPRNKWQSQIKVNGKNIHLGFYDDFEEAVKVRKEAELKYGFHKNHSNGVTKYGK